MSVAWENRRSDAAAQAAACQADAILDSIQMPSLATSATTPNAVLVDASSSSSEGSGDDESDSEPRDTTKSVSLCVGKVDSLTTIP
jgi:hypothetical protein